jgi:hypothetical protein
MRRRSRRKRRRRRRRITLQTGYDDQKNGVEVAHSSIL